MRRKLHRPHRSVFGPRKASPALKAVGTVLLCLAVVCAGFFGAMLIDKGGFSKPKNPSSADSQPAVSPDTTPDSTPNKPAVTPSHSEGLRAFYLPISALSVDSLTDSSTLQSAKAAGFTAVVFDLKDADGTLYYRFADSRAQRIGYADGALTDADLKALFSLIREAGLVPIPRLYAFCDDAACAVLTDARISLVGNPTWAWYDGDRNNGGKKWLNPYSDVAQAYVQSLAVELKNAGAAAVMLDGVQFPNKMDDNAYFGEDRVTEDQDNDTLTSFVTATRTQLGSDCPLLLGCTSAGALTTDTAIYGGNPLTFGASMVSPLLTSKVKESVTKMMERLQLPDVAQTTLAPMLSINELSAAQVSDAIAACLDSGAAGYILYHPDGQYDFAAYTLP